MPGTRQQAAEQRTTLGVVGICSKPDMERIEGDYITYKCSLGFFENQKQNMEASGGAGRSAEDCIEMATRLLHRYKIQVYDEEDPPNLINLFSEIRIGRGEYLGEEEGINVWQLQFEVSALIEAI